MIYLDDVILQKVLDARLLGFLLNGLAKILIKSSQDERATVDLIV